MTEQRDAAWRAAQRLSHRLQALGVDLDMVVTEAMAGGRWATLLGLSTSGQITRWGDSHGWFKSFPVGKYAGMTRAEALAAADGAAPKHHHALTLRGAVELLPYLDSPKHQARKQRAERAAKSRRDRAEAVEQRRRSSVSQPIPLPLRERKTEPEPEAETLESLADKLLASGDQLVAMAERLLKAKEAG